MNMHWTRMSLAGILTLASGFCLSAGTAQAVPVYVTICDSLGADWYFIPGGDTCFNAVTGETRNSDGSESSESEAVGKAYEGVALGLAMPSATVDSGKTFGTALNVGTYEGEVAFGVSAAIYNEDLGLTFNGALGVGVSYGSMAAHVGVNHSW